MQLRRKFLFIFLILSVILIPQMASGSEPTTNNSDVFQSGTLEEAVTDALLASLGKIPEGNILVADVQQEGSWAFGNVVVTATENSDPWLYLWFARSDGVRWSAVIEHTPSFQQWLPQVPLSFMTDDARNTLASRNTEFALGDLELNLPWMVDETQSFTGGPHSTNRGAIDFSGGWSGIARAAADGTVWRSSSCPNFVRVDHAGGWQTGYYHLINEAVVNGQKVIRFDRIGSHGTGVGCGGSASGPHVHFSVRKNGVYQNWNGKALGGWIVESGANDYEGCLRRIRDNYRVCKGGSLNNEGDVGNTNGFDQGRFFWNRSYRRTLNGEHRWVYWLDAGYEYYFHITRPSGSVEYDVTLKSNGGAWVATSASYNGSLAFHTQTGGGVYYLHVKPRAGKTGPYDIKIVQGRPATVATTTWNFATAQGAMHWVAGGNRLDNSSFNSSGWRLNFASTVDPMLFSRPLNYSASSYRYIHVTMNVSTTPGCGTARIFFNNDTSLNFSGSRWADASITQGVMKAFTFDMKQDSDYTGTIGRLRLDLVNCGSSGSGSVTLQKVELSNSELRPPAPTPLSPPHQARLTTPFPTFSWTTVTNAERYRIFVFDNKTASQRTVDIRQNTVGPENYITLTTPLSPMRYFWRVRTRRDSTWSVWSIRFTLFIDPPLVQSSSPPLIQSNPQAPTLSPPILTPLPPVSETYGADGSLTLPPPPNSR